MPIVTGGDQIQLEPLCRFGDCGIPSPIIGMVFLATYGGVNANTESYVPPNSDVSDQTTATRHLIDGGLADTMHLVGTDNANDEGKEGFVCCATRDMAALLNVPIHRRSEEPTTMSQANVLKTVFVCSISTVMAEQA